jgi:hypothetical protein
LRKSSGKISEGAAQVSVFDYVHQYILISGGVYVVCNFLKRGEQAKCTATDQAGIPSLLDQAVFCFNEFTNCPFYRLLHGSQPLKKSMNSALELRSDEKGSNVIPQAAGRRF